MNKYFVFLRYDFRQILRDPMLAACLFGPILLTMIVRFFLPGLEVWLFKRYHFDLSAYENFLLPFLLTAITMLPGCMAGLLMLDERDEHLIAYYTITPFSRTGYFVYRLLLPTALTVLLSTLFLFCSGMSEVGLSSFLMLALFAFEVPWIAMFLVAYAANKVEGLALSKACGLLFVGPVIVWFVPEPLRYLGVWIPTFWPSMVYSSGIANELVTTLLSFAIGVILHLAVLLIFLQKFLNRID